MSRPTTLAVLSVLLTCALGLAPTSPLAAAGTAADIKPLYSGHYNSTDGGGVLGGLSFTLGITDGSSFGGQFELSDLMMMGGAGSLGGLSVSLNGQVKAKGKVTASGTVGKGSEALKVKVTGTLGDDGLLWTGAFTVKQGKAVLGKAIFSLRATT